MHLQSIWLDNRNHITALLALVALALVATLAATGTAQAATAPVITSLGCPATVQGGQAFTCTAVVTGTVTRYSWDANNGNPNFGRAATFTTTLNRPGNHTIRLEACNGRDCSRLTAVVNITAPARPDITSLGCPATASVGQPVTCTSTVTGVVTTYRWRAEGDTPGPNNGPAFTTVFNSGGFKTVHLEACNGNVCDDAQVNIRVSRQQVPAPVINSLGCLGNAAVSVPEVCTADVSGTVTSLTWTTAEGLPTTGTGPTFSTVFSQVGTASITLQACNGASCSQQTAPIAITVGAD